MSDRLWVLIAVSLFTIGCAAKLPPHVWLPVHNVIGVDVFWWTDTQQCSLRVIHELGPDDVRSIELVVDKSLCYEMLRGEGYAVPKEPTP